MHANRLMPNVYRKKLLAFTIMPEARSGRELRIVQMRNCRAAQLPLLKCPVFVQHEVYRHTDEERQYRRDIY